MWGDALGPGVLEDGGVGVPFGRRQGFAGRPFPPPAEKIAKIGGGLAVDDAHHLVAGVERAQGGAALFAAGVVVKVRLGVPAFRTDVAAAAKRQGVVDDDHLLMVAGAVGKPPIQDETNPAAGEAPAGLDREEVLGGGHRQGRLPAQDANLQFRARL